MTKAEFIKQLHKDVDTFSNLWDEGTTLKGTREWPDELSEVEWYEQFIAYIAQ